MNPPPYANSWIGRFIGDNQRYRLDQRLGGGGMGDVFLATDTRVGHQVALKLLKDTLVASEEMRKRFEREIAVCAALESDHIVKISDCGVTPEGFPFYVMEYLRGQTLRYLMVREKQVSVERTINIITQVCKGLQLAHQGVTLHRDGGRSPELIKVIHRDLKPDNIFLIHTNLGEWVKILDFGVAKIRDDSSEQTNITNITSTFLGTFRYSAPEQIHNDKNLDARADIYSLGIILYEMLSAADPFGLSIKSRNISEASWLVAHASEPPKPLRSQLGCEHLSSQLESVVMKCLQKKPNDRFATVEELNQALQAAAAKPLIGSAGVQGKQIIVPSQRQHSPGSHDETIARPANQVEQANPPAASIQVQRQHSPGFNNDETIVRPVNQVEQANPEGTMMQPRPPAASPQQHPEGTMMQPRPPAASPQQHPESTMMQPRPPAASPQQHPEGTMIQPRPPAVSPQQHLEGTMMQPRPPAVSPQQHLEGTMMQPRPEGTIDQSTQNPQPANRTLVKVLLIFGLVFGIGMTLAVFIHIYPQWRSPQNSNERRLPNNY